MKYFLEIVENRIQKLREELEIKQKCFKNAYKENPESFEANMFERETHEINFALSELLALKCQIR